MQTLLKSHSFRQSDCLNGDVAMQAAWYALYTRGRHEKFVENQLSQRGIETYLPLQRIIRNWSDRKKEIQTPLFQSYIFARFSQTEKRKVLTSPGVVRIVGSSHSSAYKVPEKDLNAIRLFLDQDLRIDPFPYFKKGVRVYVRSGVFKGVEGYVVQKNSQHRLVISLDVLMQSISVEIDQACLELLD